MSPSSLTPLEKVLLPEEVLAKLRAWPWGPAKGHGASEIMRQAADLITTLVGERENLHLEICGGEDAPGYAASLSHEQVVTVLRENAASARRDAELAWDGETANSWKARAQAAEARVSALVGEVEGLKSARSLPECVAAPANDGPCDLERAAQACEEQSRLFADPQYAAGQPLGSFSERFACSECAKAIRALIPSAASAGAEPSTWTCRSCGAAFLSAGGKIVGGTCPNGRSTCPLEPCE